MDHIGPRMDQLGPGMGQTGPQMHQKELFLYQKYPLFCRIFFADHTLSVEIILNEVSLGGSPAISSTLDNRVYFIANYSEEKTVNFVPHK